MFLKLRQHLVIKIGVLMLMMVAAGFFASATLNAHAQGQSIERQQARAASLFAQGLGAGVRSSMLTGDPLATQQLLAQSREGLQMKGVDRVRIFAANGDEVFSPRPPPPDPATLPPLLREALTTKKAAGAFTPIAHEERCTRCHDATGGVRGVLELSTDGASHPALTDPDARGVVDSAVRAGFIQLMTARRAKAIDEYFVELRAKTPALANVVVYDAYGTLAFGTEEVAGAPAASTRDIVDAITKNAPRTIVPKAGDPTTLDIIPLPNEKRCQQCHDGGETMRGALVVTTRTPAKSLGPSLAAMSDTTVRNVMVSGLGRLMTGYLDSVAQTGAVGTLRLYDNLGRLHHDAVNRASPPDAVEDALLGKVAAPAGPTTFEGHDAFLFVSALPNDAPCQRCHGAEKEVRGAIEIVLDGREEAAERKRVTRQAVAFALGTMLLVSAGLYFALRLLVLKPVRALSVVADAIGRGDLSVEAHIGSGDEVGRLAERVNEMVIGLRQRVHLTKFVSKGAAEAVATTAEGAESMRRSGVRKHVVVLFSDIRGFTSFSETREPEEVVTMLNTYLNAQAEMVHAHHGDIDKFVGDELMAIFYGEGAELRAVRCAVDMIEAVRRLNEGRSLDGVAIGVGINTGPAIVGAMGSEDRMDFTAIGDTVNLGARLCSNAGRWQVLVSSDVREKIGDKGDLSFTPLDPLTVKGKAQPIPVFAVEATSEVRSVPPKGAPPGLRNALT